MHMRAVTRAVPIIERLTFPTHASLRFLSARAPITPDFNTSTDVHNHSLRQRRASKLLELGGTTAGSLIPASLKHIEEDEEHKDTAKKLRELGQESLTLEERKKRRRALDSLGVPNFHQFIEQKGIALSKKEIEILQINIGLYCNQACNHCHVESSPKRTEMMDERVAKRCIELLESSPSVKTLDITGGAPELNANFRYMVKEGRRLGKEVIDRCNLTVLTEPGQEDLAAFLADHQVRVVASLPCYGQKNVDLQRGAGVFDKSIKGLLLLNQLGYGQPGSGLVLDLIYNPLGAFLPPDQTELEAAYKTRLEEDFSVSFNNLFTLTNMPIKRFADQLHRRDELAPYMDLLVRNFNPAACSGLMCLNLVSVAHDGTLYDCDFNQQLRTRLAPPAAGRPAATSVFDIARLGDLVGSAVATDNHCFGCTAGAGSSCQGATV